jgi:3-hydroxyisobutyrate dehydrogenase-like beta-hydroxyacid dehydrogenase
MTALSLEGWSVGFVGLGLMGRPMARNLHRAGARLRIHNRSPGPVAQLAADGMQPAGTPRAAAEGGDAVILMVTDTAAVDAALHGADGVLAGLAARPGTLVVDMGTTAVSDTRRFAAEVEAAGGLYVDAPVSGGEIGAREASLSIMAGGTPEAVERAMPLFRVLGRRVTHVGPVGAGQVAKAANQMIVGLTIGAVAEALALARAAGVDPARVREALDGGFASSRVLELHGGRMVENRFEPGARATTQLKDMRQAEELARSLGLDLPALSLNRALYERLVARGDGGLDHSALIRLFERDTPDRAAP